MEKYSNAIELPKEVGSKYSKKIKIQTKTNVQKK
jgi:hypothetical protein